MDKPPSKLQEFKVEYINNLPPKAGFSRSGTGVLHPTKTPKWLKSFIAWYDNPTYGKLRSAHTPSFGGKKTLHKLWSLAHKSFMNFRLKKRGFSFVYLIKDIVLSIGWFFFCLSKLVYKLAQSHRTPKLIGVLLVIGWSIYPGDGHRVIAKTAERPPIEIQGVGPLQAVGEPIKPLSAPEMPTVEPYVIPVPRPLGDDVAGNDYDWGNCTFYVKSRRPDLPNNLGNADMWAINAAAAGFKVTDEPRAGAAAQVRGVMHVTYVESVNDDGTVNVSAMNENGLGSMSYYTAPASRFIYIW